MIATTYERSGFAAAGASHSYRYAYRSSTMRRWFGPMLILAGYLALTLTLPGLGTPVLSITPTHGVELSDVLGGVAIATGVATIWHR